MKNNLLKNLVKRLRESNEQNEDIKGDDSVDTKIDDFFAEYESKAIEDIKNENRIFWLLEKDEKDEESDEESDEEKEGDEEETEDEKEKRDNLNIESFASDMNRLLKNYSSLIDFKNIILRRSISFLKENYTDELVEAFVQLMEKEYSLAVGKTKKDFEEKYQAPISDRAGGGGGGGGGI